MILNSDNRLQYYCHIIILNNFVLQPTQGYKMQNKRRQKYNQNMNPNNQSYSKNYNNITQIEQFLPEKKRRVEIIPRNLNQETYLDLLLNPDISIVIASGPAGTGKTLLAMQAAIKALK